MLNVAPGVEFVLRGCEGRHPDHQQTLGLIGGQGVARQDLLALEAYEAPALPPDALRPNRYVVAGDRAIGRAF